MVLHGGGGGGGGGIVQWSSIHVQCSAVQFTRTLIDAHGVGAGGGGCGGGGLGVGR